MGKGTGPMGGHTSEHDVVRSCCCTSRRGRVPNATVVAVLVAIGADALCSDDNSCTIVSLSMLTMLVFVVTAGCIVFHCITICMVIQNPKACVCCGPSGAFAAFAIVAACGFCLELI